MKTRNWMAMTVLALAAPIALAGTVQPQTVTVDLVGMTAQGDMVTARFAPGDQDFIGCGVRKLDDGVGGAFTIGFCQARNSAGDQILCNTTNPELIGAMDSIGDFSFITFNWNSDNECTRIGVSTQSFYIPELKLK